MTRRHEFTHAIGLDAEIGRAFPLFTPLGEIAWIPGWDPTFVFPEDGRTGPGLVWTTEHGENFTLWSCLDWQPEAHRVRYVRIVPARMLALLTVACRVAGPGRTEVVVSHVMTALTPAGEAEFASMTAASYAETIEGWRRMAQTWLDAHPNETVAC